MNTATVLLSLLLAAPVPKRAEPAVILVHTADASVHLVNERGERLSQHQLANHTAQMVRLSPDKKSVAYFVKPQPQKPQAQIYVQRLNEPEASFVMEAQHVAHLFWMPDSERLVGSGLDIENGNQPQNFRHQCWLSWQTKLQPKTVEFYSLDGEYRLAGLSFDAKQFFALRTFDLRPVPPGGVLTPHLATYTFDFKLSHSALAIPAEAELTPIMPLPDGKRWLVRRSDPTNRVQRFGLYTTGKDGWELLVGQDRIDITQAIVSASAARIIGTNGKSLYAWDFEGQKLIHLIDFTEPIHGIDAR
jgi:hypothetical protein